MQRSNEDEEVYGKLSRDEYDYEEVEHYYNYVGMNAVGIEYSVFEEPINAGMHPADVLLMLAVMEGDLPKVRAMRRPLNASRVCWDEGTLANSQPLCSLSRTLHIFACRLKKCSKLVPSPTQSIKTARQFASWRKMSKFLPLWASPSSQAGAIGSQV